MALKACRECKHMVSTEAPTCPQCGAKDPTGSILTKKGKQNNGCLVAFVGVFAILAFLIYLGNKSGGGTDKPSEATNQACSSDWQKCEDNSDLVNHWGGWSKVSSACKRAAEDRSRYGTPEWPWFAFGHFYGGNSFIRTGVAIAIEPEAKFSNAFGAMEKTSIACTYDLKESKVQSVLLNGN